MASEPVANGTASGAEALTPAQKLMQQHESHNPTVEEVVDEEDIIHPPPSAAHKSVNNDSSASLSEKTAGKQKVDVSSGSAKVAMNAPPNTQSEELFPALGPVKPRAPTSVAPTWGGRKPASLVANGANGIPAGTAAGVPLSRMSAPTTGMGTPINLPGGAAGLPTMLLPGKHTEHIQFAAAQLLPRQQMKKPVAEVLRDINKRSKANVVHRAGTGGSIVFEGTGPVDAVRQALKDVANELGSKVSPHPL